MHAALWKLLWFDIRGSFRGLLQVRRSWRKLLLLLFMLVFVGLFVASQAFSGSQGNLSESGAGGRFGSAMPFWAGLYLITTWLTSSADRGLVMRPAEIHFIVAGPFPNRDIITLHLVRLAYRAAISAIVLALFGMAFMRSFPSALIGLWLLISVSLLVGMVVSLSSRRVHGAAIHRLRRVGTVIALGILVTMIMQSMQLIRSGAEAVTVPKIAAAALQTSIGQVVLPPLAWYFAPLTNHEFWPTTAMMLPARILVISVLVALVYLLGGDYLEASTARTDLSVARRQSSLRSGITGSSGWTRRLVLPQFARLFGIGPIAWMQMVHSLRILPRFLVFTVGIVSVVIVIPMTVDKQQLQGWSGVLWMFGLNSYADFLLLLQLPVGFLGPPAQRALLKSLPIANWAIVVGQLAGPFIPLALMHLLVLVLFLFLLPSSAFEVFQTSLALIPVGWVLTANINLLGAWNIIKPRALQQRDALAAGRAMASVWIFCMMLLPAIIGGTAGATLAISLRGPTLSNYLFGASAGVLFTSLLYVWLLTYSFARWQPSAAELGAEEKEHED